MVNLDLGRLANSEIYSTSDTLAESMRNIPGSASNVPGELPLKIAKRIRGECLYDGCRDAAPDGDYCAKHDAHERGRDASKKRRRRQRLAKAGLCVDGCGKKIGKRGRADGSFVQRRCPACAKVRNEAAKKKRQGVPGGSKDVPGSTVETKAERVARRMKEWENSPQNAGRIRMRGGKRGAPSMKDRDFRYLAELERGVAGYRRALELAYGPDFANVGREQQAAARREAYGVLGNHTRLGMEALVTAGEECPVLHVDEIASEDEDGED